MRIIKASLIAQLAFAVLFLAPAQAYEYSNKYQKRAVERLVRPLEAAIKKEIRRLNSTLPQADHDATKEIFAEISRLENYLENEKRRLANIYTSTLEHAQTLSLEKQLQQNGNNVILYKKELDEALDAEMPIEIERADGTPYRTPGKALVKRHREPSEIARDLQRAIESTALITMMPGTPVKFGKSFNAVVVSGVTGVVVGNVIGYLLGGFEKSFDGGREFMTFLAGSIFGAVGGVGTYLHGSKLVNMLANYFSLRIKGKLAWRNFIKQIESGMGRDSIAPLEWLSVQQLKEGKCERLLSSGTVLQLTAKSSVK